MKIKAPKLKHQNGGRHFKIMSSSILVFYVTKKGDKRGVARVVGEKEKLLGLIYEKNYLIGLFIITC